LRFYTTSPTMKSILVPLVCLTLILLFSCEPERSFFPEFPNPTVEFGLGLNGANRTLTSGTYQDVYPKADAFPDSIPVLLVGKPAAEPVIVSYTITAPASSLSATQPKNYTIIGTPNQVTIPTGRNVGYIRLLANKLTGTGSYLYFFLTLQSADKATVNSCCTKRTYYINK
jgi:hypothetical protein